MISALRDGVDALFGRGRFSTSVPVLDGPLQPNQGLQQAEVMAAHPNLDNLASFGDALFFSSGASLFRQPPGSEAPKEMLRAAAPISCLAIDSSGAMALGLDGLGVDIRGGAHDGRNVRTLGSNSLICPTAALFIDENTLIVASGSLEVSASDWKRDLMNCGRSGTVWRVDLKNGKADQLASALAFPYGLAMAPGDDILVSEAWAHRIVRLGTLPGAHVALDGLPGYPARLAGASQGGLWLCVFAPRNQLIEFVLKERGYCRRMMANVHPDFWIAPSLLSGVSFKEPLQGGAVRQMGILKPWAPTRSYGLLVRLDEHLNLIESWHSRADGDRHGITSVCEHAGHLIAGSKGAGLALDLGVLRESGAEPQL